MTFYNDHHQMSDDDIFQFALWQIQCHNCQNDCIGPEGSLLHFSNCGQLLMPDLNLAYFATKDCVWDLEWYLTKESFGEKGIDHSFLLWNLP